VNPTPSETLAAIAALIVLFALAIYFGLRVRKKNFAENLDLHAADIWPQLQDSASNFSDLLYGVWQDFSSTEVGMIVRDCRDQKVGKIVYRMIARQGCVAIETPNGIFETDSLPTLRESLSLRPANDGSQSLCDFTRLAGGTYRFDAKSFGILESKPPRGLRIAPVFSYTLNGNPVGASRHIGGWSDRGRMLVLPQQLPLPIRIFVLAVQRQRA